MPNRADCYFTIMGKNATAFAHRFKARMDGLYGEANVHQYEGALSDMVVFDVYPPHEPITPEKMMGWFSLHDLQSVVITCKWVDFTGDWGYGRWTMDNSGATIQNYYSHEDDQVDDGHELVPSGRLLAFLQQHNLESRYV